jgi:hypothetical protein
MNEGIGPAVIKGVCGIIAAAISVGYFKFGPFSTGSSSSQWSASISPLTLPCMKPPSDKLAEQNQGVDRRARAALCLRFR